MRAIILIGVMDDRPISAGSVAAGRRCRARVTPRIADEMNGRAGYYRLLAQNSK
jgi:hypothetical protein